MWGKGKTSFHEKRSFSLPPHPHPFSRKAEYFGSRWSHTLYSNKLSHPYSRSERFTFADRQTLHIAKQFFTTDEIRHFTSPNNLSHPYSRSERFTFADRRTLHIAKQFFTTDEIRHFTSPHIPGLRRMVAKFKFLQFFLSVLDKCIFVC